MIDRVVTRISAIPRPATLEEAEKAVQRVAAYARVSTDHEDQESSLAAQTDFYKKKILEHAGWESAGIFVDDGISGLTTNRREGFNRMIESCLAGHIDLVLTKSISRFARNTVDTVTTIRKLKEKGVGVYFEKENILTLDYKGEFLLTIMSSLAQEESRSISENVKWGQRKRFADGKMSLAYSRFLGYDKGSEKYSMEINEAQAKVVRRIFFLFLQGYSSMQIARKLEEENAKPPASEERWWHQTVTSILTNEKYKGDSRLQKSFTVDYLTKKVKKNEGELPQYYVKEGHETIISPWLFDYVQKRMEERSFDNNQRYSGVTVLSSKVICGKCGGTFGPRPWHSND
jgi:DNA invertase Pin-like site-specific DNA recombinase